MRFGSKYEVYDYLLTVPAGAWGIPVGVATAVLVGVIVPGWRGVAIGLVSGIGAGALAWNSSVASVWGTVSGQPSLHRASAGAAIQAAIVAVAVIDSVIVGSGEVLGFVVSNVVELIFTLLIAGVLTQVLYIIQALLAMRGVGRLPVMALSALAGGALGVGAGLVAGELLVGGVSAGWVSNATEIVIVVLGGAVVAFVFQRLGAVVGFTATATIVAASGGSYGAIAATGAVGAVAGCVLAFIANVAIRLASDSIIFKGLVFILGITAGVVIGVRSGLPVTF